MKKFIFRIFKNQSVYSLYTLQIHKRVWREIYHINESSSTKMFKKKEYYFQVSVSNDGKKNRKKFLK